MVGELVTPANAVVSNQVVPGPTLFVILIGPMRSGRWVFPVAFREVPSAVMPVPPVVEAPTSKPETAEISRLTCRPPGILEPMPVLGKGSHLPNHCYVLNI